MKKSVFYLIMSWSILISPQTFAKHNPEHISVQVDGMVCSFCAQGIEKTFKKNPAVENIKVDLDKKEVSVKLKKGKTLDNEFVSSAIKDSGFKVVKIERK